MKGLLLLVGIASAQDQKSDKDRGGVLDVLQGVLRGERQVRGNVVAVHDTDVVVRGDDARTYVVNTSGGTQGLKPGQPVSVTARSAGQKGVLVASALKTESSPTKNFQTIEGTVAVGPSPGRRPGADAPAQHAGHADCRAGSGRVDGGVDRAAHEPGGRGVFHVVDVLDVVSLALMDTVDHLSTVHVGAFGIAVDEQRGQRRLPAGSRLRAVRGEWIPGAQDRRRPDPHRRHDRSERDLDHTR
jgi:hypothetical protein